MGVREGVGGWGIEWVVGGWLRNVPAMGQCVLGDGWGRGGGGGV